MLKGEIEHVDVMKRGKNFGEAYGAHRAGEWEFAGYKLDGTYATTPAHRSNAPRVIAKQGQRVILYIA